MDKVVKGHPYAKAAVDIACYDIAGRALGVPVSTLLGGTVREGIEVTHSLGIMEIERCLAEAEQAAAEGARTIKCKTGLDPERDVELVRRLRETLGSRDEDPRRRQRRLSVRLAGDPRHAGNRKRTGFSSASSPSPVRVLSRTSQLTSTVRSWRTSQPGRRYDILELYELRAAALLLLLRHEARRAVPRAPAGRGRGFGRYEMRHRRLDRDGHRQRREPAARHGPWRTPTLPSVCPVTKPRGAKGPEIAGVYYTRRHCRRALPFRGRMCPRSRGPRSRGRGRRRESPALRRMSRVAVLGVGAGGCAVTVDLIRGGHCGSALESVRRNNRALPRRGRCPLRGSARERSGQTIGDHGGHLQKPSRAPKPIIVCMPALGHELAARLLARAGISVPDACSTLDTPCGALHFRAHFHAMQKCELPPLAELSTLTLCRTEIHARHASRSPEEQSRCVVAALPGGEEALTLARNLFPSVQYAEDVLATEPCERQPRPASAGCRPRRCVGGGDGRRLLLLFAGRHARRRESHQGPGRRAAGGGGGIRPRSSRHCIAEMARDRHRRQKSG